MFNTGRPKRDERRSTAPSNRRCPPRFPTRRTLSPNALWEEADNQAFPASVATPPPGAEIDMNPIPKRKKLG